MMTPSRIQLAGILSVLGAAAALSACGGGSPPPAPGSPERPLVAQAQPASKGRSNEASQAAGGQAARPGYETLLKRQTRHPRSRFTPCNLVTRQQARTIIGAPVREPIEASQGPTCVYRSQDGSSFVTLAVQSLDIDKLKPRLRLRQRVNVSRRTGICGTLGQPVLLVPVSGGQVLSVTGHCGIAARFARVAVRQLPAGGR
jgi:Protein of unknown function (DUF3558)